MKTETILVLDFGGQNSLQFVRMVRKLGVYCEILPHTSDIDKIKSVNPKGIIFAMGQSCADFSLAPKCQKDIFLLDIPLLAAGRNVNEYAKKIGAVSGRIFDYGNVSSIDSEDGVNILNTFIKNTCACACGWQMEKYTADMIEEIKEKIGNKKALCALSGGVDSMVSAVLISKAIGNNLTCIFVDHGLMRKNEGLEVQKAVKEKFDLNLISIDAEDRFLGKLKGVADPEQKRKIIGEEFIRVFEEEAKKIGKVDFLVQGTIYPDIVESGIGNSALVKSHHNVGGLPDYIDFDEIIEPVRNLFKDEVREVGRVLDIPEELVSRQPFPGPGLGVRVLGELTKEKLDVLRDADAIFREEIALSGLNKNITQYFAVLTGMKSVGVKNDKRTYAYTLALRAVETIDFMTAKTARISYEILENVSSRIINEVENINRVVYDITAKPPATIEWE